MITPFISAIIIIVCIAISVPYIYEKLQTMHIRDLTYYQKLKLGFQVYLQGVFLLFVIAAFLANTSDLPSSLISGLNKSALFLANVAMTSLFFGLLYGFKQMVSGEK